MTLDEIKNKLNNSLTPIRYAHSINVMECAVQLALKHGIDKDKAAVAGLLHDCAKDIDNQKKFSLCTQFNIELDEVMQAQPELIHGPLGSRFAELEYGVRDYEIFKAIYCHTTGCENMSTLDKIIYLADIIEPDRKYDGVGNIKEMAFIDIDATMILALDMSIRNVMAKGKLIHHNTINARNFLIVQGY